MVWSVLLSGGALGLSLWVDDVSDVFQVTPPPPSAAAG